MTIVVISTYEKQKYLWYSNSNHITIQYSNQSIIRDFQDMMPVNCKFIHWLVDIIIQYIIYSKQYMFVLLPSGKVT